MAQSCVTRTQIEAKIWNGDSAEAGVKRDVVCTKEMQAAGVCKEGEIMEEFLPASHPSFDSFRCMVKTDLDKVIEEALKHCK